MTSQQTMPRDPQIVQVPCLNDNYCYLIHEPANNTTLVIDTPDGDAIQAALEEHNWSLDYILTTHHHWDHIDGHEALVKTYGCEVIGSKVNEDQIPCINRTVSHGDNLQLGGLACTVLATPGHTLGHVVYHFPGLFALFTGDTLFSMGCGRLFEGTPEQMWQSMQALKTLPELTRVYCGHEYTLSNARFALAIEPDNKEVQIRVAEVESLRQQDRPTTPTLLKTELQTNPFLRADDPQLQQALEMTEQPAAAVFAQVRQLKDQF